MNSPDYTEFLKWCVAIERSLPGRPEKAYAIMSVVLSKELGNWHAARVLVGLKEINLFRSQKVFQALLHLWQIKELNLAALLSEVELGLLDTPNKVIETFLNPVFAECFEYAYDMERAGKESVYDSLMVVLKQYNLDSQMDNIIAAGVERLHHAVTSEVEKLRRILHYLVFQLNKKTNPIPILESFIIPHGSSNAISRTYDRLAKACHPHGNDEAKSEWLINSLTGSLLEPQLFVIMYKMNSKQHHTGFPAIVLKQLAKHWQESPSSSYDTALTLFQQFQFEKLPAGVKNDQYELNRLESWKAFIDLAYGKQTSIPVSLLNDIVKQGNGAVTYAMLEHIWAVVLWHEQATSAKELEKSVIL
ncbi:hypothetical protein CCR75_009368 [Bremia lactucae]|uniref:Uncharacterized protein n=1 Tax=Bremia lactucae TaxID=4779 RepID=A0A976FRL8_BRELC|nr:hypothetical protein CCR75_009368 [Bremia lactucae]